LALAPGRNRARVYYEKYFTVQSMLPERARVKGPSGSFPTRTGSRSRI